MTGDRTSEPDGTAVRTALWRALHVQADAPPHVFEDEIGLRLVAPGEGRRSRPDMEPRAASGFRAAVVARARFIEDLVAEQAALGVTQYVVRGAGLDTFAQRRPEIASRLRVLAIDQPGTQAWKRRRLAELGYDTPAASTSCRSTSKRASSGWGGWPGPASTPAAPRSSSRPASPCTSPGTPPRSLCARSPRSPPARRSP